MSHGYLTRLGLDGARRALTALVPAVALLASSGIADAATSEDACQSGLANAAGKYALCAQKAVGKFDLDPFGDFNVYAKAAGKCVTKYTGAWPKLQAKAAGSGSTCDSPRFVDNADGTVTDRLTGLQWEKKVNLDGTMNGGDPHDADNTYTWTAGGSSATGSAFTTFVASLNSGCFAGQCDWRLPTRDELLTIETPPFPACTVGPCVEPALGPTAASGYWSATTFATFPSTAWGMNFSNSGAGGGFINGKALSAYVRAVR